MADDAAFEARLRESIARVYRRPARPGNPVSRLLDGSLKLEEARLFWTAEQHQSLLFFTEVIAPHLMESCADLDARIPIWNAIYLAFGRGRPERSYPCYFHRLLVALGGPAQMDDVLRDTPEVQARRKTVQQQGFVETLVRDLLVPATIGSHTAARVADALVTRFQFNEAAVRYFRALSEDKSTLDVAISLVCRYATTAAEREQALRWLEEALDQPPVAHYAFQP